MSTPSPIEVVESCLTETTMVADPTRVAADVISYLESFGYVIAPRDDTKVGALKAQEK